MAPGEIWRQFGVGPKDGRRFGAPVILGCLAVLFVVALILVYIGAVGPRIRWSFGPFFLHPTVEPNGMLTDWSDIDLENEGAFPITVTDISMDIPGLRLLPADEAKAERDAVTVDSGGIGSLRRRIVVTDCTAVPHEPQPVRFSYRTWLWSGEAEVIWPSGKLTGSAGVVPIAWQRVLALRVCNEVVANPEFYR